MRNLEDYAKVDQMPVLEGKRMTIMLSPKKQTSKKKDADKPKDDAAQAAPAPEAPEAPEATPQDWGFCIKERVIGYWL